MCPIRVILNIISHCLQLLWALSHPLMLGLMICICYYYFPTLFTIQSFFYPPDDQAVVLLWSQVLCKAFINFHVPYLCKLLQYFFSSLSLLAARLHLTRSVHCFFSALFAHLYILVPDFFGVFMLVWLPFHFLHTISPASFRVFGESVYEELLLSLYRNLRLRSSLNYDWTTFFCMQ